MATEQRILLTPEGKAALERERDEARGSKRPALMQHIQELTNDGDVSDNSEYEDVKEELMQLEARIREIENILQDARVVEHADSNGVVIFGSNVTLIDGDSEAETWTIVGPQEANPRIGKISNVSPVGSALLGKRVGDTISVAAPGGETVFTIKDVS